MRQGGAWGPLLQGLCLDRRLLRQPNTKKRQGAKDNCTHAQLGQIMNSKIQKDFPGGAVVKNTPANAGDTGSSPGPGRSHMPWSN